MNLYLIDGYGFVFRAYHSLPPLTRSDGTPINAVYGFTNMLLKFIANHEADMIAVMLDTGKKNFRHDMYQEYKANRPLPPQDLIIQFPIIREVIEAFDIISIEKEGVEADDLIASYALKALDHGINVKIVSSDKDLMQLVNEDITLYDAMKDRKIGIEEVKEKYGVIPEKLRDTLALIGDSSDNIPGVDGIGPKTASTLINEFGSLENIYTNLDKVTNERQKTLLINGREKALLSKKLVSLKTNLELDYRFEELKVRPINEIKLFRFLNEQGFKSLVSRLQNNSNHKHKAPVNYVKLDKFEQLKSYFQKIELEGIVSIFIKNEVLEISTNDLNLSIEFKTPIQGNLFEAIEQNQLDEVLKILEPIFSDSSIKKVLYDAKSLYKELANLCVRLTSFEDVKIIAYVLNTSNQRLKLDELLELYLTNNNETNSNSLLKLFLELEQLLVKNHSLALYTKMEQPLIKTLAEIEIKGVKIDINLLKQISEEFNKQTIELELKIWKISNKQFNIGSPKQLGEILFEEMKIPIGKKSKTGTYSTSASILEQLAEQGFDIADLVLEWRRLTKLLNTYTEALPKSVNPKTGRVHTTFLMTATSTGRLSSTDPNLQNIPVRTEDGQRIRKAFIAEPGNLLISADYSQIELRLLAEMANVGQLKSAFINGEDIHVATAIDMFGVKKEEVNGDLRRKAKTINFGIIYGISPFGLARRLDIPREMAKIYIDQYFAKYPGIKEYMNSAISFARTHGYMTTLFGRKCHINGINDKNYTIRSFAERAAINAPLQGTAADIIKKVMVALPEEVAQYMILQIHDELLFEVPENKTQTLIPIIKNVMESTITLSIPIEVDIKYGKNWGMA